MNIRFPLRTRCYYLRAWMDFSGSGVYQTPSQISIKGIPRGCPPKARFSAKGSKTIVTAARLTNLWCFSGIQENINKWGSLNLLALFFQIPPLLLSEILLNIFTPQPWHMGLETLQFQYDKQRKHPIGKLDFNHLSGRFFTDLNEEDCHTKRWLF